MRSLLSNPSRSPGGERGSARTVILFAVSLALGFAAGAFWMSRRVPVEAPAASVPAEPPVVLSAATKAILKQIEVPVEVDFFGLISSGETPAGAQAMAKRVGKFLEAIESEAPGKVKVRRQEVLSAATADAARAAGIEPLDRERNEASYLGLVASAPGNRETLKRLGPEWAQAFEADVARVLERVGKAPFVQRPPADVAVEQAAAASVKAAIVDPEKVPLEEGIKILRQAAQKRFEEAVKAMQADMAAAQQKVLEAERGQSDSDRAAAVEQLKQIQASHGEKLEALTHEAQAQIDAWTKAKGK